MDTRAAKRREKEDDDRLSELPQPILHHILSFLSQKVAVQTCLLSKSWRDLGSTRPIIDLCAICDQCRLGGNKFCENCFGGNQKAFISVLDKTLQRYHDQKLFAYEFRLKMLNHDPESISLLAKWVPKLITLPYLALNTLDIRFFQNYGLPLEKFNLPWEVFHIKSLEKLYLEQSRLNQIDFVDKAIQLNRLQTLSLYRVLVADETLEKIISSCPLIENVALELCEGLRTVKMINKHPNLKRFCYNASFCHDKDYNCRVVEIDAPALETIEIVSCPNWYLHNKYLSNLKTLRLDRVHLSSEFFENFSSKFPCLEELDISECTHFDEFHLSSRSIKHLTISYLDNSTKAIIDAPNILFFKFIGEFATSKLSFTKIPSECESLVDVEFTEESGDDDVLPWFVNLHKLLRALGLSQITLQILHDRSIDHETIGCFNEPVVVKHLCLHLGESYENSSPSLLDFLNGLFHICRPKYADVYDREDIPFISFLCTILVQERERRVYHWQQDLEAVEMEFWDKNANEWNPTTLEEFRLLDKVKIRFRLEWRD